MNIVEIIRRQTQNLAAHTAIVEGDHTITYGELLNRSAALGRILISQNVTAGQRIALRSSDGIDYVIASLAILESGAAVVPLSDTLTEPEAAQTIEWIDVAGILSHRSLASPESRALDETFSFQPRVSSAEQDQRCRDLGAAFLRFSSGTTGRSKGVVLSHAAIEERTDAAHRGLNISDQDVILWVLGMSHHFVVSILLFLRKGATIVVATGGFPFSVLDAVKKLPITFIYASPVHFYLLAVADAVEPQALCNVRLAVSTSMKMPAEIFDLFHKKFGIAPAEAYGIIEIGLPFINTDPSQVSRQTVGRVLPDYELQIAGPDDAGIGRVLIRGKGMFDAYFSPWRLRRDCLEGGWFDTGDLGRLDESGRLLLLGRGKTVIVCAGMKVFPEEVEETINSLPGVKESLVSGRDHPQYGQTVVAQVVLAGTADSQRILESLPTHCRQRLSSYKVPVEFQIVQTLPKTSSGKLARVPAATA